MRTPTLAFARDSQAGPLPVVLPADLPKDVRDKLDELESTSEDDDPLFRPLPAVKLPSPERSGPLSTPRATRAPTAAGGRAAFVGLSVIGVVATAVGVTLILLGPPLPRATVEERERREPGEASIPGPLARTSPRTVAAAPPVATPSPEPDEDVKKPRVTAAPPPPMATGRHPTQLEEHRTFGD